MELREDRSLGMVRTEVRCARAARTWARVRRRAADADRGPVLHELGLPGIRGGRGVSGSRRPRRPGSSTRRAEQIPGELDPTCGVEVAHTTARAMVHGRAGVRGPRGRRSPRRAWSRPRDWTPSPSSGRAARPGRSPAPCGGCTLLREWVRRDCVGRRRALPDGDGPGGGARRRRRGGRAARARRRSGAVTDAVLSGRVSRAIWPLRWSGPAAFCRVLATGSAVDADLSPTPTPSWPGGSPVGHRAWCAPRRSSSAPRACGGPGPWTEPAHRESSGDGSITRPSKHRVGLRRPTMGQTSGRGSPGLHIQPPERPPRREALRGPASPRQVPGSRDLGMRCADEDRW